LTLLLLLHQAVTLSLLQTSFSRKQRHAHHQAIQSYYQSKSHKQLRARVCPVSTHCTRPRPRICSAETCTARAAVSLVLVCLRADLLFFERVCVRKVYTHVSPALFISRAAAFHDTLLQSALILATKAQHSTALLSTCMIIEPNMTVSSTIHTFQGASSCARHEQVVSY
jgi:hypothetical protein